MTKTLRLFVGIILLVVATRSLFSVGNSHVSMCMVGAIALSLGFILSAVKPSEFANKLSSFSAGWILFYTILTATTMMLLSSLGIGGFQSGSMSIRDFVFWYHLLINFVILLLFWSKIDDLPSLFLGFATAATASPLMLILQELLRQASMEPTSYVVGYFILGAVFLAGYFLRLKNTLSQNEKAQKIFRTIIILILAIYIVGQGAIGAMSLAGVSTFRQGPGLQGYPKEGYMETKYSNPFDEKNQYVNPFSKDKNPFDFLNE